MKNPTTSNSQGSLSGSTLKSGTTKLGVVSAESLDYNLTHQQVELCSSGNAVCAAISSLPGGSFYHQKWVIHDSASFIDIKFNTNVSKDFHLANISNTLVSEGKSMGHLSQLDTSECDNLVATGATLGKSCKIYFTASSEVMEAGQDQINLAWKWNQGQNNFTFSFPFINKEAAFPTENPPILNTTDMSEPLLVYIPSSETTDGTNLEYPIQIYSSINLINTGFSSLTGNNLDPTIKVQLANRFNTSPNMVLSAINPYFTSCAAKSVNVEDTENFCNFPFIFIPDNNQSAFADLVFQYTSPQVNYLRKVAFSIGDIIPFVSAIGGEYARVTLSKHLVNNDNNLTYNVPLSNLTFSAKFEPLTGVGTKVSEKLITYGYGDFTDTKTGQKYTANELIGMLKYNYDPNCLSASFDPDYYGSDKTNGKCPLEVAFTKDIKLDRPFMVNLYANYDSQTQNRFGIHQYIGTITFSFEGGGTDQVQCNVKKASLNNISIPTGTDMYADDCYFTHNSQSNKLYKLLQEDGGDLSIYECDPVLKVCSNKIWGASGSIGSASFTEFSPSGHLVTFSPGTIHGGLTCSNCSSYYTAWISDLSDYDDSRKFSFNNDGTLTIIKDNSVVWSSASSKGYYRDGNQFLPVDPQQSLW